MRKLIFILLLLCAPPLLAALGPGDAAPALKGTALDGKAFDLAALKGKVVVVNLWATWCGPCREEMPLLDNFAKRYRERGVVLVGVSEDEMKDAALVKQAMAPFTYPALLAEDAEDNGFRAPRVLPVTYVIDTAGVVRAKLWAGGTPVTEDNLRNAVEPLLAPPR